MSTQAVLPDSSSTEQDDVFQGKDISVADYNHYRSTGELPPNSKADSADSAPAYEDKDSPEGDKPKTDPDSDPDGQQERNKKPETAEDRIAKLEKTIERIRAGAGLERKADVAPAPDAPKPNQAPQTYAEWEKGFVPDKWIEGFLKENPDSSYEKANAAMFSLMLNARDHFKTAEQQRNAEATAFNTRLSEARELYGENFDEVIKPTAGVLASERIPKSVREMLNESDLLPHVAYVLGSDPKTLEKFVDLAGSDQAAAKRYIVRVEGEIEEALSEKEANRGENGKFVAAPAKKQTSAPKPPTPVGGKSSGAFDVSDDSLSAEEWARQRTAQLNARK